MIKKRGFLEISFAWLFGIIAGAIILAIAIFAVTRLINIGQYSTSAQTQGEIGALLNPLETSFQAGQITSIGLPVETRIYNKCEEMSGIFGLQIISLSQLNLGKWSGQTNGVTFQNKYIFSDNATEGKQFYLFSKPFNFPFKVSDLIYITSSSVNYCFVNPPSNIQDELSNLNEGNINLVTDISNCSSNSITVCFPGNCNVSVDYTLDEVTKNGSTMTFYNDALMYGAIFADKNVYECQLKRLMERGAQLSSLYLEKSNVISPECGTSLNQELIQFNSMLNSFSNSNDILNLIPNVNQLQNDNDVLTCKLW